MIIIIIIIMIIIITTMIIIITTIIIKLIMIINSLIIHNGALHAIQLKQKESVKSIYALFTHIHVDFQLISPLSALHHACPLKERGSTAKEYIVAVRVLYVYMLMGLTSAMYYQDDDSE